MSGLADEIEAAEAHVAALKRCAAAAPCAEVGHDWVPLGGANAGCGPDCCCSIPVHECRRCGDCDYGDNDEAIEIIRACREDPDWDAVEPDDKPS
ncbi:hypothetical protein F1188_18250 [Roseospira marina]|uniref:Uncharacterized protein n=1 Tax=Roseospira marina TaxID=140057 RepID=A0A5M6I761_9PROT|nr:hypothetical protein [Roseospira marina]KAA5603963.1 hypothetical protein F1188_18250 [Roseospira marina]MBB4315933.1 hypothetical protein [Roseospira marina]MBB5089106.1 hypothetical protein [Roseospira marina]